MRTIFMKIAVVLLCCFTLVGCNTSNPDEYFQTTVLNSNILFGFATEKLAQDVINEPGTAEEHYSLTLYSKISYVQKVIDKIESTKAPDADAEKIRDASLDLYKFALPVFENEYTEIAKLATEKADKALIDEKVNVLDAKYQDAFYAKYDALIALGKAYAEKHQLNVKFD